MFCEKCGKQNATTHIHTVINGVVYDKFFCDECAALNGLNITPHNSFSDIISLMLGDSSVLELHKTKTCPTCGMTFSKIAKSGRVGCSECYKAFKTELLPYLKRLQGSTKHIGAVPEKSNEIDTLKEKLKGLIFEERYEEAAVIRDKIKILEANRNE